MGIRRREHGGILAKLLALLLLVCVAGGIYLLRHPILREAGDFWVVEDPIEHSDAIVVLGDDDYSGDRAARAAELYREGWAPVVVASGRMLRPYAGIAELEAHDLEADGVPQNSVVQFAHRAENTREEALALRGLLAQRGWHNVVIVTSNYHTRRARFIFSRVLPEDVTAHVASAPDANYDPGGWWYSRQGIKLFSFECVGYLVARWELRDKAL
ncbi:MAG: YdcF family protein [Candidatus Acidiferrales bacterium]